uniref:Cytochrome P450 n=1 Tax=Oryza glumipatula TaxID=40148 RepID=A0A0E0AKM0_9ORYZ
MDEEVRRHIDLNWVGHKTVTVAPLARRLAFDIICSVIFGQGVGPIREALAADFETMVKAMLSIPVNIPFTKFNKGLNASRRIRKVLRQIARDMEGALQQGYSSSADDFFTYMLVLRSKGTHSLTVEDIVDNAIVLLAAGYETSSVLITFLIRCLANEPDIFGKITDEQEEIARSKSPNEPLTWDDVSRMKYTWKVALEILRTISPIFGSFRTAIKDIEYQGYHIPKGWQSISLLRALCSNTDYQWYQDRIKKYGPVFKMSLFGSPTVLMAGPAANHFVFSNQDLIFTQTKAINTIIGRSILTLSGEELKQVRGALQGYLRPEMVTKYMRKMDEEVRRHIDLNWVGHKTVKVAPLAKRLTFDIICSVVFGQGIGPIREALATDFETLVQALLSLPVNIPFTKFNKGLSASRRIRKVLRQIAREREAALQQGHSSSADDFFTYMLVLRSEGTHSLTVEDIVDNAIVLLTAGYGNSAVLITFLLRYLANDPDILRKITEEQEEIASSRGPNEPLTWDDVSRMKYTWKVALETLRTVPPIFGSFRTAIKDIEYQGYHIPKGWKVFTAQSITHLDGNFFNDPVKFDPTRFDNQTSIPPYCFVPFGGGPRMCPGNEFARTETLVTMHYLVRQFRWKLCCKEEGYRKDPLPMPVLGLPIELETRSPP